MDSSGGIPSKYDLESVRWMDADIAYVELELSSCKRLVLFDIVPGSIVATETDHAMSQERGVRLYETKPSCSEQFALVTTVGDCTSDMLEAYMIERVVVFDGGLVDMCDYVMCSFVDAEWSNGLRQIVSLSVSTQCESVASFLESVQAWVEGPSTSEYPRDLWLEFSEAEERS
jgi:hypothetical protein